MQFSLATDQDAAGIAALMNSAADDLTARFGTGHWSNQTTERGVIYGLQGKTKVLLAREGDELIGTFCLGKSKPWVIDADYFTPVKQPIYLTGMAVHPAWQFKGIGRRLIEEAKQMAAAWPADAIRLDAYDADAGAGGFYVKCGFAERGGSVYRGVAHVYFEWMVS